ncbi:hypothetical protein ACRAWD_22140 [Caulobacter segnis]
MTCIDKAIRARSSGWRRAIPHLRAGLGPTWWRGNVLGACSFTPDGAQGDQGRRRGVHRGGHALPPRRRLRRT